MLYPQSELGKTSAFPKIILKTMKSGLLGISLFLWFLTALFYVGWLLPPILLLGFGDLWEVSPSHFVLRGLAPTGGLVVALYVLSVLIVGIALLKVATEGRHDHSSGYQIFLYVSGISFILPILEGMIGSCTISSDFSGVHLDCQSGTAAVLPALLASIVLIMAAVASSKFASSQTSRVTAGE